MGESIQNRYKPLDIESVKKRRKINDDPLGDAAKRKKFKVIAQGSLDFAAIYSNLIWTNKEKAALRLVIAGGTRIEFSHLSSPSSSSSFPNHIIKKTEITASGTYTRFKDFIKCVDIRSDGRLAAAADGAGLIQLIDCHSRTQLRRLRGHRGSVNAVRFVPQVNAVLSGGADAAIRVWDYSDGTCRLEVQGAHMDSIQALATSPSKGASPLGALCFASGGDDGYVNLWDLCFTEEQCTCSAGAKLHHGHPVHALSYFPHGPLLLSGGGTEVKVWDTADEGRLLSCVTPHIQAISALAIASDAAYIVTGSADKTLKLLCPSQLKVLYSISLDEAVASVSVAKSTDGVESILLGLSDGRWQLRRRSTAAVIERPQRVFELKAGTQAFLSRGADSKLSPHDRLILTGDWQPSGQLERMITTFRHQDALDKAIKMGPAVAIALIEMLIEHGVVPMACRGRDEATVLPLLDFATASLGEEFRVTHQLLEFLDAVLRENPWLAKSSDKALIDGLQRLTMRIENELAQHHGLQEICGIVELVFAEDT